MNEQVKELCLPELREGFLEKSAAGFLRPYSLAAEQTRECVIRYEAKRYNFWQTKEHDLPGVRISS